MSSNPLGRVKRHLSREPENMPHKWMLLLASGPLIFAGVIYLVLGATYLLAYALLAMGLALVTSWLSASLPVRRRGLIAASRTVGWVLAIVGLVFLALSLLYQPPWSSFRAAKAHIAVRVGGGDQIEWPTEKSETVPIEGTRERRQ